MTVEKFAFRIVFSLLVANSSQADSYYPASVPTRPEGIFQSGSPSCQSEAEINAMENAMARRAIFTKISRMHYDYAIKKISSSSQWEYRYRRDPVSDEIVDAYGAVVPEILSPNDSSGFYVNVQASRPFLIQLGEYFQSFPQTLPIEFSRDWYHSEGSPVDYLKRRIYRGEILTLSLNYDELGNYQDVKYGFTDYPNFRRKMSDLNKTNHSVALVGYDDDNQSFIIINSWNTYEGALAVKSSHLDQAKLRQFRLKILRENHQAYYLIPYELIRDMGSVHGTVMTLDMQSLAAAERAYRQKIGTAFAIFECDQGKWDRVISQIKTHLKYLRSGSQLEKEYSKKYLDSMLEEQVASTNPPIKYLKLPYYLDGISRSETPNRLDVFYNGEMTNYSRYLCPESPRERKPSLNDPALSGVKSQFYQHLKKLGDRPTAENWLRFYEFLASRY